MHLILSLFYVACHCSVTAEIYLIPPIKQVISRLFGCVTVVTVNRHITPTYFIFLSLSPFMFGGFCFVSVAFLLIFQAVEHHQSTTKSLKSLYLQGFSKITVYFFKLFSSISYRIKYTSQNYDISAKIEPQQKNDHAGQGPIDQRIVAGHPDKVRKNHRSSYQRHRSQQRSSENRHPRLGPGSRHAVNQHHQQQHQPPQCHKPHPVPIDPMDLRHPRRPVPHQQVKKPVSCQHRHHGGVNGDQQ